uniref:Uncharacterized protein n=1 Tax=Anguilla anguilla TaxID=7936 RepID=A0A0E9TRM6_ANGAN
MICSMGVIPVPPAIMPTCLAVLITGSDFLSGLTAKPSIALIDEQSARSAEIDGIANTQAFQVLGHLPTLRELGVNIFVIKS